jgi:hypothetical protein
MYLVTDFDRRRLLTLSLMGIKDSVEVDGPTD